MNRTGPKVTKAEATSRSILTAARAEFAERGHDRATIRAIARRAGVDPALVLHYYGSKERLFLAATEIPIDPQMLAQRVIPGPPSELGDRMLAYALALWSDEATGEAMRALVRSALADGADAKRIAAAIEVRVLGPLGAATQRPDGELRAALALSQGLGLAITRHLIGIPALVETPDKELRPLVEPTLRRYLSGDLAADPG